MGTIDIELHHDGVFKYNPTRTYGGGGIQILKAIDVVILPSLLTRRYGTILGCNNVVSCWCKFPWEDMEHHLKLLDNDNDVQMVVSLIGERHEKVVELYIEHGADFFEHGDEFPRIVQERDVMEDIVEDDGGGDERNLQGDDDLYYEDYELEARSMEENNLELEFNEPSYNSEELKSWNSDSDAGFEPHYPEFYEDENRSSNVNLEVGLKYASHKEFKSELKEYAIEHGFDYFFKKNDRWRVTAVCKRECGWRIHASLTQKKDAFQIKTFSKDHVNCSRHRINLKINASWIAKKYLCNFRDAPSWGIKALQSQLFRDFNVNVSLDKCYRAKSAALKAIYGSEKEQYASLWRYAAAILKWNPGSTVKIKLDSHKFQRLYICYRSCKVGFKSGCRPIICLDGCHLKSKMGGQLLAAIGQDANDDIFPIAIAAVEAETKESWTWFVSLLLSDIGDNPTGSWTFMSDQQKGLVETIKEIAPTASHRLCLRHLCSNFKKQFKGKQLKDLMWRAARATTVQYFERTMKNIKELSPEAHDWLARNDPKSWSRHAFDPDVKSDILVNNNAESFNSSIVELRDNPIVTLMEGIRIDLMEKFQYKRDRMRKSNNLVCPRIKKKLEKRKHDSKNYILHLAGDGKYEVEHYYGTKFVVDLKKNYCGCRLWQLTGIPCIHAILCINEDKQDPIMYIHPCYSKEAFLQTYAHLINPVPSCDQWPIVESDPISPPSHRIKPGRPKKNRKKDVEEERNPNKVTRRGLTVKCGKCHEMGHNSRSCKATSSSINRSALVNLDQQTISEPQQVQVERQPSN